MDKLCCSNSFKERRSIYCYKNSLFACFIHASRPVSRSSLVLSRKAAAKVKPFFVTTNFFRNFFFKNLSAFKKNRTSRTSANHRQSTLICGGKDMAFIGYDPNISESIFHLFCYLRVLRHKTLLRLKSLCV